MKKNHPSSDGNLLMPLIRLLSLVISVLLAFIGQGNLHLKGGLSWPWFLAGFLMASGASVARSEHRPVIQYPRPKSVEIKDLTWFLLSSPLAIAGFCSVYFELWSNRVSVLLWVASIAVLVIGYWVYPTGREDLEPKVARTEGDTIGPLRFGHVEIAGF
ncbi:MAG: hypothetical protein KC940_25845, partial [Candidatus Omnitrophica bacterium]|nr:hypothetical protein [Candidatus Omnitrophota bacterium]